MKDAHVSLSATWASLMVKAAFVALSATKATFSDYLRRCWT
jgi:hypothetical protein